MEDGVKKDIPLDSPIDVHNISELSNIDNPKFLYNNQKLQGNILPNSLHFEHDGWAAGDVVYDISATDNIIPFEVDEDNTDRVYAKRIQLQSSHNYLLEIYQGDTDDRRQDKIIGTVLVSPSMHLTNQNYGINNSNSVHLPNKGNPIMSAGSQGAEDAMLVAGYFHNKAFAIKQFLVFDTTGNEPVIRRVAQHDSNLSISYIDNVDGVTTAVIHDNATSTNIQFAFTSASAVYVRSVINDTDYKVASYIETTKTGNSMQHHFGYGFIDIYYTDNSIDNTDDTYIVSNSTNTISDSGTIHNHTSTFEVNCLEVDNMRIDINLNLSNIKTLLFAIYNMQKTRNTNAVVNTDVSAYTGTTFSTPNFSYNMHDNYLNYKNPAERKINVDTFFKQWQAVKVTQGKLKHNRYASTLLWLGSGIAERDSSNSLANQIGAGTSVAYDIYLNCVSLKNVFDSFATDAASSINSTRTEMTFANDIEEGIDKNISPVHIDAYNMYDYVKYRLAEGESVIRDNNTVYLDLNLMETLKDFLDKDTMFNTGHNNGGTAYRNKICPVRSPYWLAGVKRDGYTRDNSTLEFGPNIQNTGKLFQGDWGNGTIFKTVTEADRTNIIIKDAIEYNNKLYAVRNSSSSSTYDTLYYTDGAFSFEHVTVSGLPAHSYNTLFVYANRLYICGSNGIFRADDIDVTSVTKVCTDITQFNAYAIHDNKLYISGFKSANSKYALFVSSDGVNFTEIDSYSSSVNNLVYDMCSYKDSLFIGTRYGLYKLTGTTVITRVTSVDTTDGIVQLYRYKPNANIDILYLTKAHDSTTRLYQCTDGTNVTAVTSMQNVEVVNLGELPGTEKLLLVSTKATGHIQAQPAQDGYLTYSRTPASDFSYTDRQVKVTDTFISRFYTRNDMLFAIPANNTPMAFLLNYGYGYEYKTLYNLTEYIYSKDILLEKVKDALITGYNTAGDTRTKSIITESADFHASMSVTDDALYNKNLLYKYTGTRTTLAYEVMNWTETEGASTLRNTSFPCVWFAYINPNGADTTQQMHDLDAPAGDIQEQFEQLFANGDRKYMSTVSYAWFKIDNVTWTQTIFRLLNAVNSTLGYFYDKYGVTTFKKVTGTTEVTFAAKKLVTNVLADSMFVRIRDYKMGMGPALDPNYHIHAMPITLIDSIMQTAYTCDTYTDGYHYTNSVDASKIDWDMQWLLSMPNVHNFGIICSYLLNVANEAEYTNNQGDPDDDHGDEK